MVASLNLCCWSGKFIYCQIIEGLFLIITWYRLVKGWARNTRHEIGLARQDAQERDTAGVVSAFVAMPGAQLKLRSMVQWLLDHMNYQTYQQKTPNQSSHSETFIT